MRLFLVRHPESQANVAGVIAGTFPTKLSSHGLKQARLLAKYFSKIPLSAIYCSPLPRSLDTAKLIAEFHPLFPTVDPNVSERKFGVLEGAVKHAAMREHPEWFILDTGTILKPPGGEGWNDLSRRVHRFWQYFFKKHAKHTVLIVGHLDFNRVLLSEITGKPVEELQLKQYANAGITELEIPATGPAVVLRENDETHLGALAEKKVKLVEEVPD